MAGLLFAALVSASLHQAARASATEVTADEAAFLADANALRAAAGLAPLRLDEGLSDVARAWSSVMAQAGDIWHNPNLATALGGWPSGSTLRENVGMGPGQPVVQRALVASPSHHANLANPRATRVGIGVVRVGAVVFVTQNFLEEPGARPREASPASGSQRVSAAVPDNVASRPARAAATVRMRLVLDQLRSLGV